MSWYTQVEERHCEMWSSPFGWRTENETSGSIQRLAGIGGYGYGATACEGLHSSGGLASISPRPDKLRRQGGQGCPKFTYNTAHASSSPSIYQRQRRSFILSWLQYVALPHHERRDVASRRSRLLSLAAQTHNRLGANCRAVT